MNFIRLYNFLKFPRIENKLQNFLHRGCFDPGLLTGGPRGPHGRLGWPGRLGNAQHDRLPVTGEGRPGTALRREKRRGERGRPDRTLTQRSPVVSVWPEDGRRRQIWLRRTSVSGEETVTPAVIGGERLRFFWLGGRGRRGAPSQHVRGAGGGTEWRRYASGSDYCEFSRERGRGRRGRKEERPGREKGAGSWRPGAAPEGPRRPGQAGGGEVDVQGASTQELPVSAKKTTKILQNAPWFLGFSETIQNSTLLV
jgi:hypothetical protein